MKVNEYCGIMLCYDFIKLAWGRRLKDEADEGKRGLLKDRVDFLDARFSEKVAEELVWLDEFPIYLDDLQYDVSI